MIEADSFTRLKGEIEARITSHRALLDELRAEMPDPERYAADPGTHGGLLEHLMARLG